MAQKFKESKWGCQKSCPLQTSKKHTFIKSMPPSDAVYIYPNIDQFYGTDLNDPFGDHFEYDEDSLPYIVSYDARSEVFIYCSDNLLMLDWDNKDLKEIDDKSQIPNFLIDLVQKVANGLSEIFREEVVFSINPSDRGFHAFLLSHPMDSQNQNVLEFMEQICTDAWYIAFTPLRGWCVRISPKNDTFNDFVAKTTVEVRNDESYEFPDIGETEDMEFIVSGKNTLQRTAKTNFPEIYANYLIINALIGFYKAFNYKQYLRLKQGVSCFDTSTMNNLRINVYYINLMAQQVASDGIMNQAKMISCINYGRELGLGLASYYN
jgi:hypothetical protein